MYITLLKLEHPRVLLMGNDVPFMGIAIALLPIAYAWFIFLKKVFSRSVIEVHKIPLFLGIMMGFGAISLMMISYYGPKLFVVLLLSGFFHIAAVTELGTVVFKWYLRIMHGKSPEEIKELYSYHRMREQDYTQVDSLPTAVKRDSADRNQR